MPDADDRFDRSLSTIRRADSDRAEAEKDRALNELEAIVKARAECLAACIDRIFALAEHVGASGHERHQAYAALGDTLDDIVYRARHNLQVDIETADEEIARADRP